MKKLHSKFALWLRRHGWGTWRDNSYRNGLRLYTVREEASYRWTMLSTYYMRRSMSRALIKKRESAH